MSEVKDPAIKLFGKTICLLRDDGLSCSTAADQPAKRSRSSITTTSQDNKNTSGELSASKQDDEYTNLTAEESVEAVTSSHLCIGDKAQNPDKETQSRKDVKKDDESEASDSQEKALKKPDKILPCPRCNSMDTKFCYYNNYNVNQPRHFCKNCQRYWTAGGSMRNVPVGSGRRKNKTSASNYRHIMVSEALHAAQFDVANGSQLSTLKPNGTVLTFGSDRPVSESMGSVLTLVEKSQDCLSNGYHQRMPACYGGTENANDHSSGSYSTSLNSAKKGSNAGIPETAWKNFQGFPAQVRYFNRPPWPCSWNAAQWRSPIQAAALTPPGTPVSLHGVLGTWNAQWISAPASPGQSTQSTTPTSLAVGKHSRDGDVLKPSNSGGEEPPGKRDIKRRVLIPKTLKIDDPNEVAKSSIWSSLGIKNEKEHSPGASLFKAFNSNADDRNHISDNSLVLQANPAALSRSLNFQERT